MPKLSQTLLNDLINHAESELRTGGTLTQMVNKIENIAFNLGFKVDRKEVKDQLIAKCAREVLKDALPHLPVSNQKLQ